MSGRRASRFGFFLHARDAWKRHSARLNEARLAQAMIDVEVVAAGVHRAQLERAWADADAARAVIDVARANLARAEMTLADAKRGPCRAIPASASISQTPQVGSSRAALVTSMPCRCFRSPREPSTRSMPRPDR